MSPGSHLDKPAKLAEIAEAWTRAAAHLYAGIAFSWAVRDSWGVPDAMGRYHMAAAKEFARAAEQEPHPLARLTALRQLLIELSTGDFISGQRNTGYADKTLRLQMARGIEELAANEPDTASRDALLVRGFHVDTDLLAGWSADFSFEEAHGWR